MVDRRENYKFDLGVKGLRRGTARVKCLSQEHIMWTQPGSTLFFCSLSESIILPENTTKWPLPELETQKDKKFKPKYDVYLRKTSAPVKPLSGNRDAMASNSSSWVSPVSSGGFSSSFGKQSASAK